jgi:hypothetical protein
MEHSIDLSAKHFVNAVAPSSTRKLLKKIKHAFEGVELDNDLDLDTLDAWLAECDFNEVEEDEDEGSGETFKMEDSIGKALALVKQACGL